ncbi:MAG: hypothetical protein ACO1N5_11790, partial [Noviherbaspirillum sp.]
MSKHEQKPGVREADEAFDPWEQVRPIPLFVIAVIFALALWGTLTYISEHAAQKEARTDAVARQAGAGVMAAEGLTNADPTTLLLVE